MISLLSLVLLGSCTESGTLLLKYEPKVCITTPCPQFSVIKKNNEKVSGAFADLENVDLEETPLGAFHEVTVGGCWNESSPNLLMVTVKEWEGAVRGKVKSAEKGK